MTNETYTRDSDGKRFRAEKFQYGMKTIGGFPNIQGSMKYAEYDLGEFFKLEPIEENPMPWPEKFDVIETSNGTFSVEYTDYMASVNFKLKGRSGHTELSEVLKVYRNGKLLWEAKK